jgi:molybdenum cofactor cytidylyltransferase
MSQFVGILLAAGKGSRFDPTGAKNKLLQPLANGDFVVSAAAENLLAAVPSVLAVVRPGANAVAAQLRVLGCEVSECPTAEDGMAASLVHALSLAENATGWVIALGDMPYVRPATITALIEAIENGADIALPTYRGQRGNPVAFGRRHLPRLLELRGDQGARSLLKAFPVAEVAVEDAGIVRDIDVAHDLRL